MKYRSFNEELLIATALLVNVFNDIVIDRRTHGLKRDYSKPLSLNDIVQQKIEIPCVIGDRSNILRSLENEQGKYKLPLIILQNKSIKTDVNRMVDLHADVFYQQDISFSELDPSNPLYKPQQLSKRRGQPIIMDFDMTIITKYKEDMDQILSNWIVHFRPDVYVKWWHPRVKLSPLTSQILWNHNVGFESPVEYTPTNIFTYKSTTTFSFKTWLFPGIIAEENNLGIESIIEKIKFFPNRSNDWDDEDLARGFKDENEAGDFWYFGNLFGNENENDNNDNEGQLAFWGVRHDQDFYNDGSDESGLKDGKYMVNNVFAKNYPAISGDPYLSGIYKNPLFGDIFTKYDRLQTGDKNWIFYQKYLNENVISSNGNTLVRNVHFRGGWPEEYLSMDPPSGDYLFHKFAKSYIRNKGMADEKHISAEFGEEFSYVFPFNINYDIISKNLTLSSFYKECISSLLYTADNNITNFSGNININAKSIYNSENGIYQEFNLVSNSFNDNIIKFHISRRC